MSEDIDVTLGSSLQLGGGYDLLHHSAKNSPFDAIKHTTDKHGDALYQLEFLESSSEISRFFSASASASLNAMFIEGSASGEFLKNVTIEDYSLLFLVRVSAVSAVEVLSKPKLGKTAGDLLKEKNFDAFRAAYGDYYVSALTRGGELYGLIRIRTHSALGLVDMKADLGVSADVGLFSWDSRASFMSKLRKLVSEKDIHISFWTRGLTLAHVTPPTSVEHLIEIAEAFPHKLGSGGMLRAELQPMNTLPDYQHTVAVLTLPVRHALDHLWLLQLDYTKLRDNIDFMLSPGGVQYFDWDHTARDSVMVARDAVLRQLRAIDTLAAQVVKGEIKPKDPKITGFEPAYRFDNGLKLPNAVVHIDAQPATIFPLRHTRGDSEMDENNPKTTIEARLVISSDRKVLSARANVKMEEGDEDYTTFVGSETIPILDLRQKGLKILGAHPFNGHLYTQAPDDQHGWQKQDGEGLIQSATYCSDTDGDDTGKLGVKQLKLRPVTVVVSL